MSLRTELPHVPDDASGGPVDGLALVEDYRQNLSAEMKDAVAELENA